MKKANEEKTTTAQKVKTGALVAGVTLASIFALKSFGGYLLDKAENAIGAKFPNVSGVPFGGYADLNHHRHR